MANKRLLHFPKVVAIVYECPNDSRHTHKVKLGESFYCRGTVFFPREVTIPNAS